jgi:hypothetical protein
MLKLQVNTKLEQDDIQGTKSLLEQCIPDDSETIIASACVLYKVCWGGIERRVREEENERGEGRGEVMALRLNRE